MGVEAVKSGNNSITEENTDENEETEDSKGSDDEEIVRDNFLRTKHKHVWHPKTMLIYIYYTFSQCKMTDSWKSNHLVVMQKI